jgi:hypothetical protein
MTTTSQSIASQTAEAFADKVFKAALGTMETFNLYLGDRLGWLDALADASATAGELAERTNTHPRYAIEWLEMMAVYGNLIVLDDGADNRLLRRYALPPGAAEALTGRHSLNYQGALPQMLAAVAGQLDKLLEAYRSGGGVSWTDLGDDARDSQAALNRFESALAPALAEVPAIDSVLQTSGARIADIGCGAEHADLPSRRPVFDAIGGHRYRDAPIGPHRLRDPSRLRFGRGAANRGLCLLPVLPVTARTRARLTQ